MKFKTIADKQHFLATVEQFDMISKVTEDFVIPLDLIELFLQKRTVLVKKSKDQKKSSAAKAQWRASKWNMLSGIRKYHKSTNGKRHHRELGRFLATRENFSIPVYPHQKGSLIKALSSTETHAFIELEYYQPSLKEEVDYWLFLETIVPVLNSVKENVLEETVISEEAIDTLVRMVDTKELLKAVSEEFRRPLSEVEKQWKNSLLENKKFRNNHNYYHNVMVTLKNSL